MQHGFIGISRHRIGVDGEGVTTLAAFHGCPLRCRYCLNDNALRADGVWRTYSPATLYKEIKKDHLYFVATGGGVTFGGGEPLLYTDFIISFRQLCTHLWKINIETSLNVPDAAVRALAHDIDHWIVDIKDMDPRIYKSYTGRDNTQVIENLKTLVAAGAKITARVPMIPGYNTAADVDRSIAALHEMGIADIDRFTYTVRHNSNGKR